MLFKIFIFKESGKLRFDLQQNLFEKIFFRMQAEVLLMIRLFEFGSLNHQRFIKPLNLHQLLKIHCFIYVKMD